MSNLCRVKDPCKKADSEPKKGHLVEFNRGVATTGGIDMCGVWVLLCWNILICCISTSVSTIRKTTANSSLMTFFFFFRLIFNNSDTSFPDQRSSQFRLSWNITFLPRSIAHFPTITSSFPKRCFMTWLWTGERSTILPAGLRPLIKLVCVYLLSESTS